MERELYNLKMKILRSKHISNQLREELANDVFEIEKLVNKTNDIHSVSNTISLGRKVVKNGEIGKVIKRCSRGFNWWIVDWNRGTQTEEYGSDLSCC